MTFSAIVFPSYFLANAILSGHLAGDYHFQATIPVTNDFSGDFRIFQALFLITVNFSGSFLATVISFPVTSNLSKNSFCFNFLVLITVLHEQHHFFQGTNCSSFLGLCSLQKEGMCILTIYKKIQQVLVL